MNPILSRLMRVSPAGRGSLRLVLCLRLAPRHANPHFHRLAAAAGLVNLDILEKEGMVQNAKKMGAYMNEQMKKTFADHPMVGEVRGAGLLTGALPSCAGRP